MPPITEDRLTRLGHESVLMERLPKELLRASSYEHTMSLLGIRVEVPAHLKSVVFYPLLKAVARKVRQNIRAIDLAVRLGDDLVLLLAETPAAGALRLGEKLTEVIDRSEYDIGLDLPDLVPRLRCAAAAYPEDGETAETLIAVLKERLSDSPVEPRAAEAEARERSAQAGAGEPEVEQQALPVEPAPRPAALEPPGGELSEG